MPTPKIFDFDVERISDYDAERLKVALADHPALMVNHLFIAAALTGWAERMEQAADQAHTGDTRRFDLGYAQGLREVAAHLRQCDYLPGGAMLEDVESELVHKRTSDDIEDRLRAAELEIEHLGGRATNRRMRPVHNP